MQISVFGPLSIVRVLLHRCSRIIFSFSNLSSNEHFLKWVFIININMTLLMNSFSFAKLHHFCFLANHDCGWALDHLYPFILLRFDWWHFICHLFQQAPIYWDEIGTKLCRFFVVFDLNWHTFKDYWVKKCLIRLWNCPPPQTHWWKDGWWHGYCIGHWRWS